MNHTNWRLFRDKGVSLLKYWLSFVMYLHIMERKASLCVFIDIDIGAWRIGVLFSSRSVVGATYHLPESTGQVKADVGVKSNDITAFEYCSSPSDAESLSKG